VDVYEVVHQHASRSGRLISEERAFHDDWILGSVNHKKLAWEQSRQREKFTPEARIEPGFPAKTSNFTELSSHIWTVSYLLILCVVSDMKYVKRQA
jgi:hypothetical protein